jgi:hypothetical protein
MRETSRAAASRDWRRQRADDDATRSSYVPRRSGPRPEAIEALQDGLARVRDLRAIHRARAVDDEGGLTEAP